MRRVEREVGRLLREANVRAERGRPTAEQILKLEQALWTFVDVEGVEPTNNCWERLIRHAMMYRKTTSGRSPRRKPFRGADTDGGDDARPAGAQRVGISHRVAPSTAARSISPSLLPA